MHSRENQNMYAWRAWSLGIVLWYETGRLGYVIKNMMPFVQAPVPSYVSSAIFPDIHVSCSSHAMHYMCNYVLHWRLGTFMQAWEMPDQTAGAMTPESPYPCTIPKFSARSSIRSCCCICCCLLWLLSVGGFGVFCHCGVTSARLMQRKDGNFARGNLIPDAV